MWPRYSFMLDILGETESDLADTASLMLRLLDDNRQAAESVYVFVPFPGTELFKLSIEYGLTAPQKLEEWIPFTQMNVRLDYPWLSPETKKLVQMLYFCSVLLEMARKPLNFSNAALLVSLLAKLYRPIA